MSKLPATTSNLPATRIEEQEEAIMQHAREALKAARAAFVDGDPFERATMHATTRTILKGLSDFDERNAARTLRLALGGSEDAHEALADLIAERGVRSAPLGPALSTYVNILADSGPSRFRQPAVRPPANFMANLVIICMLIDLEQQFLDLRLRRNPLSKRPSRCSVVAATLKEAGLKRGGEEAIHKIWQKFGPPAAPEAWASRHREE